MACCLFCDKPSSEPIIDYCQLNSYEYISVEFESKCEIFIKKNAFESVVFKTFVLLCVLFFHRQPAVTELENTQQRLQEIYRNI